MCSPDTSMETSAARSSEPPRKSSRLQSDSRPKRDDDAEDDDEDTEDDERARDEEDPFSAKRKRKGPSRKNLSEEAKAAMEAAITSVNPLFREQSYGSTLSKGVVANMISLVPAAYQHLVSDRVLRAYYNSQKFKLLPPGVKKSTHIEVHALLDAERPGWMLEAVDDLTDEDIARLVGSLNGITSSTLNDIFKRKRFKLAKSTRGPAKAQSVSVLQKAASTADATAARKEKETERAQYSAINKPKQEALMLELDDLEAKTTLLKARQAACGRTYVLASSQDSAEAEASLTRTQEVVTLLDDFCGPELVHGTSICALIIRAQQLGTELANFGRFCGFGKEYIQQHQVQSYSDSHKGPIQKALAHVNAPDPELPPPPVAPRYSVRISHTEAKKSAKGRLESMEGKARKLVQLQGEGYNEFVKVTDARKKERNGQVGVMGDVAAAMNPRTEDELRADLELDEEIAADFAALTLKVQSRTNNRVSGDPVNHAHQSTLLIFNATPFDNVNISVATSAPAFRFDTGLKKLLIAEFVSDDSRNSPRSDKYNRCRNTELGKKTSPLVSHVAIPSEEEHDDYNSDAEDALSAALALESRIEEALHHERNEGDGGADILEEAKKAENEENEAFSKYFAGEVAEDNFYNWVRVKCCNKWRKLALNACIKDHKNLICSQITWSTYNSCKVAMEVEMDV